MDTIVIIWAAMIVVFLIIEGATAGLASIWFALGAVAGLVLALADVALGWQISAFIVVSTATLILTRPLAVKYVNTKVQATNADRVIGQTGVVVEEINNIAGTGTVKIDSRTWTARSVSGNVISKGVLVTGVAIAGATLQVSEKGIDGKSDVEANINQRAHAVASGEGEE